MRNNVVAAIGIGIAAVLSPAMGVNAETLESVTPGELSLISNIDEKSEGIDFNNDNDKLDRLDIVRDEEALAVVDSDSIRAGSDGLDEPVWVAAVTVTDNEAPVDFDEAALDADGNVVFDDKAYDNALEKANELTEAGYSLTDAEGNRIDDISQTRQLSDHIEESKEDLSSDAKDEYISELKEKGYTEDEITVTDADPYVVQEELEEKSESGLTAAEAEDKIEEYKTEGYTSVNKDDGTTKERTKTITPKKISDEAMSSDKVSEYLGLSEGDTIDIDGAEYEVESVLEHKSDYKQFGDSNPGELLEWNSLLGFYNIGDIIEKDGHKFIIYDILRNEWHAECEGGKFKDRLYICDYFDIIAKRITYTVTAAAQDEISEARFNVAAYKELYSYTFGAVKETVTDYFGEKKVTQPEDEEKPGTTPENPETPDAPEPTDTTDVIPEDNDVTIITPIEDESDVPAVQVTPDTAGAGVIEIEDNDVPLAGQVLGERRSRGQVLGAKKGRGEVLGQRRTPGTVDAYNVAYLVSIFSVAAGALGAWAVLNRGRSK